jgi:CHAD domain-containing protein
VPEQPTTIGQFAQSVLRRQLAALLAREAGVRSGDDPEAVHQMRVATRRLRAALSLFADVIPADVLALRRELGWLADTLGAVRDFDVQMTSLRQVAEELRAEQPALSPLFAWFAARRASARDDLTERLDSARYAALLGSLGALSSVNVTGWPGDAGRRVEEALPERLHRRHRRFRKAARAISAASAAVELHRARIRAKQLRYSLEFASGVYGKPAQTLIRRAVGLQDLLGAIQDAVVMDERLRALSSAGHELPPSSIFLAGQLAQCFAQRATSARAQIPRSSGRVLSRKRWKRLARSFPVSR